MSTIPAMMTRQMLSDEEYQALCERVAKGKEILEGKWGATDWQTKQWINLWFTLSDQLLEEMKLRGIFGSKTIVDAEGHLEQIREQMIAKGLAKRPKERRAKKSVQSESDSHNLFESS